WHLNGTRKDHHDGTHVDAFHGTITDLNINGTFTKTSSFMWMSDSWYLDSSHTWVSWDSFTFNFSIGHVHATATFRAPYLDLGAPGKSLGDYHFVAPPHSSPGGPVTGHCIRRCRLFAECPRIRGRQICRSGSFRGTGKYIGARGEVNKHAECRWF